MLIVVAQAKTVVLNNECDSFGQCGSNLPAVIDTSHHAPNFLGFGDLV